MPVYNWQNWASLGAMAYSAAHFAASQVGNKYLSPLDALREQPYCQCIAGSTEEGRSEHWSANGFVHLGGDSEEWK